PPRHSIPCWCACSGRSPSLPAFPTRRSSDLGTDADEGEVPYTVYILEDTTALSRQVEVFRAALWRYLGGAGLILLLVQVLILRWSLRPLRRVIWDLKRVQRGDASRMSERHPRELEPLAESINAFI